MISGREFREEDGWGLCLASYAAGQDCIGPPVLDEGSSVWQAVKPVLV
jgi:hypothetical protein